MSFKSYTLQEVRQLKRRLTEKSVRLQNDLGTINTKIKRIDNLIAAARSKDHGAEIIIPQELFEFENSQENTSGQIKWKDCVLKTITASNKFLSCNAIFTKLLIDYPFELGDRRVAIKSISSALVNLVTEGKIGKFKDDDDGLFYYGDILKHFEKNGRPNMVFHKKATVKIAVA